MEELVLAKRPSCKGSSSSINPSGTNDKNMATDLASVSEGDGGVIPPQYAVRDGPVVGGPDSWWKKIVGTQEVAQRKTGGLGRTIGTTSWLS